ncbi:PIN-like domain-containing protein [Arthrobacter sp. ZGTC412]|uniref:PIN-like domain-containing protein n=1 Tax=Arthrobacter sp. ZGTC412 TaxID=2058900 RepID=UPI000CE3DE39|nr:PIN domain-containing protein [Arthrobacter sp. ZGTC412]
MRDVYGALMPLPEGNFEHEFRRAIVVLDTNVMLDMYRFSRPTSQRFLDLLEHIEERLWLPHQVGLEFLRRRPLVRDELPANHGARIDELKKLVNKFESAEKKSHVGHDKAEAEFIAATKQYVKYLTDERDDVRRWATAQHGDEVLATFRRYYDQRTGQRPSLEWVQQSTGEGEKRYKNKRPPGYEDAAKESNQYGDYFLWKQCIEKCQTEQRPLLFVTGDVKSDWWETGRDKKRLGPRVELVEELFDESGQHLFMLDTSQFFERLRKTIEASITEDQDASDAAQTEIDAAQARRERHVLWKTGSLDDVWWSKIREAQTDFSDVEFTITPAQHPGLKVYPSFNSDDARLTNLLINWIRENPHRLLRLAPDLASGVDAATERDREGDVEGSGEPDSDPDD